MLTLITNTYNTYFPIAEPIMKPVLKTGITIVLVSGLHEVSAWFYYKYCANRYLSWVVNSSVVCNEVKGVLQLFDKIKSSVVTQIFTFVSTYKMLSFVVTTDNKKD